MASASDKVADLHVINTVCAAVKCGKVYDYNRQNASRLIAKYGITPTGDLVTDMMTIREMILPRPVVAAAAAPAPVPAPAPAPTMLDQMFSERETTSSLAMVLGRSVPLSREIHRSQMEILRQVMEASEMSEAEFCAKLREDGFA